MEAKDKAMDFIEDYYMYEKAMDNAYYLITRKKTLPDIINSLTDQNNFALPFDPTREDGRTPDILDMLIEHFERSEEFEKCSELMKIKDETS